MTKIQPEKAISAYKEISFYWDIRTGSNYFAHNSVGQNG